jgi:hypothetical protein
MPTVYSGWQGTGYKGRVRLDYNIWWDANRTVGYASGTFYASFGGSISDSSNSWSTAGICGAQSGSKAYSVPSGGGDVAVVSWGPVAIGPGGGNVAFAFQGIEAIGAGNSISGTFLMDPGPLAPYMLAAVGARDVTATSFTTTGINATGNGGALVDIQMQYSANAASEAGPVLQAGGWADITASGLRRATPYYFRVRVANNTYGWGPWGGWNGPVYTLSTTPSAPAASWGVGSIEQTTAVLLGLSLTDDGGSACTGWGAEFNTSATSTGARTSESNSATVAPLLENLLPGTVYHIRVRAKNANGWGAYSDWKTFTTLPGVFVKVNDAWKTAIPFVNVQGTWKQAIRFVKANGNWVQ